jgi:hypothetical protein
MSLRAGLSVRVDSKFAVVSRTDLHKSLLDTRSLSWQRKGYSKWQCVIRFRRIGSEMYEENKFVCPKPFYVANQISEQLFFYFCDINLKRKWALLESNSPAIGFMALNNTPFRGSFYYSLPFIAKKTQSPFRGTIFFKEQKSTKTSFYQQTWIIYKLQCHV